MIYYKILKQYNIIIEYFEGKINFENISKFYSDLLHDDNYSPEYLIVSDIRKAEFEVDALNIKEFIAHLIRLEQKLNLKSAIRKSIIADSPKQVALATLFRQQSIVLKTDFEIFGTPEAGLNWLAASGFSEVEYEKEIIKLKNFNHIANQLIVNN